MDSDIYIEQGGSFVSMTATPYTNEAELQALLERNAGLLGGHQMSASPLRFALVKREAGVPDGISGGDRWSLDHLFIDHHAVPTLVEVKRSTDTRIRREVVGQMLDYAANAVIHWADDRLRSDFVATCTARSVEASGEILRLLGLDGDQLPDDSEDQIDQFWAQAASNLRSGRLRLLFVADEIPSELRRIIEFLNERMAPTEVLGVEIRHYTGGDLRLVVPTVIGHTAAAEQAKGASRAPSPPIAEVLATASEPVRRAAELLAGWAAGQGVEVTDLPKSIRYSAAGSTPIAYLYPGQQYRSLYLEFGALEAAAGLPAIRQAMADIQGKPVGGKTPAISCQKLVENWDAFAATVLGPLVVQHNSMAPAPPAV